MITKFKIFEDMFDVAFRTGSENKPNFEIGDTVVWYFCNDFISETEYDSKKYNL